MEQDLKLRGLSPCTRRNYLLYCRKFAAFYMRSPEELGAAEVRAFLLHQIEVEQLAYASYRQVYAALKFLYSVTLGRPGEVTRLPFPRRQPSPLPRVLSAEELTAFFAALRKPKYRALFTTCYAAGLRLGEVCRLQVQDIDSRRMVLHVRTVRIRHYGVLAGRNVATKLARCRQLLGDATVTVQPATPVEKTWTDWLMAWSATDPLCCPRCQGPLTRQALPLTVRGARPART